MKNKCLVITLFTFMFLCFPFSVRADCDYSRLSELSKIASNVKFSYNYDENNYFTITATNITNDVYVVDSDNNYFRSNDAQATYYSGEKVTFNIYSNDSNCPGELLLTRYITFPSYNIYYSSDECKENPDFQYCKKWVSTNISSAEFNNLLNSYKNTVNTEVDEDESLWEIIVKIVNENIVVVAISGILILGLLLSFIIRKFLKR